METQDSYDQAILNAKESEISAQIKKRCNSNGIEKNPKEIAELLHKLGLVYLDRSPNKISLVRSAVLLNAAISRQPDKEREIRRDLNRLCSNAIAISGAKNAGNLEEIAQRARKLILKMRQNARIRLSSHQTITTNKDRETQKYLFIQDLQKEISTQYREVMENISTNVIDILGEVPCKWAHVGMGSLAREEVTPYSDFESVIILEDGVDCRDDYEDILDYFRWFTTLFQICVANIGETIVPSVAVSSLNNFLIEGGDWFFDIHTPHGICCDGFMPHASKTPFGRFQKTEAKPWTTELIKPISKMCEYLDKDVEIKNGYHLGEILSVTCFVAGYQEIHDQFQTKVRSYLKSNFDEGFKDEVMKTVSDQLRTFSVFNTLPSVHATKKINAKKVIYRSVTLFVSTVGRFYGSENCSCFGIILDLRKMGTISEEAEHNLNFAVAVACEVRLKVYLNNNGQNDSVFMKAGFNVTEGDEDLTELVDLYDIVGYFKIAYCLQKLMSERAISPQHNLRDVGKEVEIAISYYFNQYSWVLGECRKIRDELITEKELNKKLAYTCVIYACLFHLGQFDDAVKECKYELEKRMKIVPVAMMDIGNCRHSIGRCLVKLDRFEESIVHFNEELKCLEILDASVNKKIDCAENIATAYFKLGLYEKCLEYLELEMNLLSEDLDASWSKVEKRVDCILNMAGALYKLSSYQSALLKYRKALNFCNVFNLGIKEVAQCKNGEAHCLFNLGKVREALDVYKNVLVALESVEINSREVIDCLTNIGNCYLTFRDFHNALKFYKQSLERVKDTDVANHLNKIGRCHYEIGDYKIAIDIHTKELAHLRQSGKIEPVCRCLNQIACNLYKLQDFKAALDTHFEELNLRRQVMDKEKTSDCLNNIASCYSKLGDFQRAMDYYKMELEERKHT